MPSVASQQPDFFQLDKWHDGTKTHAVTVPSESWKEAMNDLVVGHWVPFCSWPAPWIFPYKNITIDDAERLVIQPRFAYRLGYTYQVLNRHCNRLLEEEPPRHYTEDLLFGNKHPNWRTAHDQIWEFIAKFRGPLRRHAGLEGFNLDNVHRFETWFQLPDPNQQRQEYRPKRYIAYKHLEGVPSTDQPPFVQGLEAAWADIEVAEKLLEDKKPEELRTTFPIYDYQDWLKEKVMEEWRERAGQN